jgi:hypothetical protein
MKQLVESIIIKEYTKADQMFHEEMNDIVSRKLNEAKKMYAAKMFSEQLNVDKKGNYEETGGRDVVLSHEKQKRGLAEDDVVPFAGKSGNKSPKVHVGNDFVAVDHGDKLTFHKNEDNKPGKMLGSLGTEGIKTFRQEHSQSSKEVGFTPDSDAGSITKERAVDYAVRETMREHKPDLDASSSVKKLKEEAKRAAMRIMQEKVRVKNVNVTPEKIKAAQKYSDETSEEKPTDPAAFFRKYHRMKKK